MAYEQEISRRKTFAIISHPDAGKTTLTEKLLLFGGQIQSAGAVKSNKITKAATSDFMEIEKQRGISVATSVMSFEYRGKLVNILDTPGHKDFAEDTYRTLSAVDSVILVIDSVKGVEEQTEKLMEVCRMRATPVITFINKMDRDGKDPFDLLDEVEQKLNIHVHPMSWPINSGRDFKGVYLIPSHSLNLFESNKTKKADEFISVAGVNDPQLPELIGERNASKLREDIELIDGVYGELNRRDYLEAHTSPVFFGSGLNNFGVQELLETFLELAPTPVHRPAAERLVEPTEAKFSGFVFKIHANIDPRHRDRIAFLRVCSGKFERNKPYRHVRLGKDLRFANPYTFLARSKEVVEDAYAGDVVGLYDTGNFKIGDTLTEGEMLHFKGIPSFSPEIFKELINLDPLKSKQLEKGIEQLTEEGLAQLFRQEPGNRKYIGTVGELQFEVLQHRLEHEYGAKCRFEPRSIYKACWMGGDEDAIRDFMKFRQNNIAWDKDNNPVYLAETQFTLRMTQDNNPKIQFRTMVEVTEAAQ
ncbi:MAG: peptide chain release factor 3 [Bacteroidetes bacterium]|nr:peptide chain release factor 3 [Bacteroidota bacterium]